MNITRETPGVELKSIVNAIPTGDGIILKTRARFKEFEAIEVWMFQGPISATLDDINNKARYLENKAIDELQTIIEQARVALADLDALELDHEPLRD